MRLRSFYLLLTLFALMFLPLQTVAAAPAADVGNDTATLDFPNTITFSADLTANSTITSVMLE